jgi:hypothetical protein
MQVLRLRSSESGACMASADITICMLLISYFLLEHFWQQNTAN